MSASPAFAHAVYFTLNEPSAQQQARLIAACQKYLSDHPGTVHFSAGGRAPEYQRPVNDQQFDVALLLVFASEADHDRYQVSEQHQQFLAELSDCWSQVRVFDAFV
jgi:hypothetical protein